MKLKNIKATLNLEISDIDFSEKLSVKELNNNLIKTHRIMQLSGLSINEMREKINLENK